MTSLLPQLFYLILKISFTATNVINYVVKYLGQDFPMEQFGWQGYIFIPFIIHILHGCFAFIQGIFLVPLYSLESDVASKW
jgi:hypothetical protein